MTTKIQNAHLKLAKQGMWTKGLDGDIPIADLPTTYIRNALVTIHNIGKHCLRAKCTPYLKAELKKRDEINLDTE